MDGKQNNFVSMDTHNNIILQQEPVTLEQGLTFEEMVLQQQENKKSR
jgi:hypothetical protein